MKPDLFFLPYGDKEILYAPLKRFVAEVNAGARAAAALRLSGGELSEEQEQTNKILEKYGVFDEADPPELDAEFSPTRVTLFPSDKCNLRCLYCYASAEKGESRLSMPAARAAIDFVIENAKKLGHGMFGVGFHGNGEPFSAAGVIQECCEYTESAAEANGLKFTVSAATNGVMPEAVLDRMLAWITDFNISSDILPDLQNEQRPLADGGPSFERVDATIKRLDAAGVQYGIRATITAKSVGRLREMAEFVKDRYPNCNLLHFEPVFEVGRALKTGQTAPEPETFVREYCRAQAALSGTKIRPVYSGERADSLCCSFCSVCRNGFTVTAEGNVTSCYEICTYRDGRAKRFIYGKFDAETGGFIFDRKVMDALAELTVNNIPYCRDCFCKWNCGGDCVAKTLGLNDVSEHRGSARCVITRALIYRQLLAKLGAVVSETEPVFV